MFWDCVSVLPYLYSSSRSSSASTRWQFLLIHKLELSATWSSQIRRSYILSVGASFISTFVLHNLSLQAITGVCLTVLGHFHLKITISFCLTLDTRTLAPSLQSKRYHNTHSKLKPRRTTEGTTRIISLRYIYLDIYTYRFYTLWYRHILGCMGAECFTCPHTTTTQ